MKYKESKFNFIVELHNMYYIYNTLYSSLSSLTPKEFKSYQNKNYSKELKTSLIKQRILIPDSFNEEKFVLYRYNKSTYSNNVVSFRILTTNLCNARCFYCYEDTKSNTFLKLNDAKKLIEFVEKESHQKDNVSFTWFGGEPLLNYNFIDEVYNEIVFSEHLSKKKIRSHIITNGSLLNDSIINKMINLWKVNDIQITLDGLYEEHNRRKNYFSINNAFNVTIENIKKLINKNIKIHLRLNYDSENIKSLLKLIEYLSIEINSKNNIDIYAYPLFDIKNKSFNTNEDIKKNDYILREKLIEFGFLKPTISKAKNTNCIATSPNGYVINADGKIYRCSMCVGNNDYSLGDIYSGFQYNPLYLDWLITKFDKKCTNCNILPMCLGGCSAKRILGMTDYCSVKKYTLENEIKFFIKEFFKTCKC